MRRAATLGLLAAIGLGGGCAEFDDWTEPEHAAEYRRAGAERDDRTPVPKRTEPAGERAGVYPDR